jgi:hypothetical protein
MLLQPITEAKLKQHNKTLSAKERQVLATMNADPERQMRWAINPAFQSFLECTINQMSAKPTKPVKPESKAVTVAPEPLPDPDDETIFNMWD